MPLPNLDPAIYLLFGDERGGRGSVLQILRSVSRSGRTRLTGFTYGRQCEYTKAREHEQYPHGFLIA